MLFTKQQILEATNAYELFKSSDDFAENKAILEALSDNEKKLVAKNIISNCPEDKFRGFPLVMRSLASIPMDKSNFYIVLNSFYEIRASINALASPSNPSPHLVFVRNTFNVMYKENLEFAREIFNKLEALITARLVERTPVDKREAVISNLTKDFAETTFITNLTTKFADAPEPLQTQTSSNRNRLHKSHVSNNNNSEISKDSLDTNRTFQN